jgi:DNA-binding NarL/FixJ family response regulator
VTVRVLIADDHAVVRQGLRMFLGLDDGIDVIGETTNGREAVRLAQELCPDVVLMDLLMPVMDGIEATAAIRRDLPEVEVVALTSAEEHDLVVKAVQAGAIAFLHKSAEADELRQTVRSAAAGQAHMSTSATALLMGQVRAPSVADHPTEHLTDRENDVLAMLARGKANKEIAHDLRIGQQTVKTHVSRILSKLGAHSRTQAAMYAVETGLVVSGDLSGT